MPNNPLTPAELQAYSINPTGIPQMPAGYFLASPVSGTGPFAYRLFDASYISIGIIDPNRLGTGSTGAGTRYLADDGTWKLVSSISVPTPTLAQVTTAGNTTTNSITVGSLNVGSIFKVSSIGSVQVTNFRSTGFDRTGLPTGAALEAGFDTTNNRGFLQTYNTASLTYLNTVIRGASIIFQDPVGTLHSQFAPNTNNLLINTSTDAGYKLDVNGTFRSNALWTTSAGIVQWGPPPSAYGVLTWDTGYARIHATTNNRLDLGAGGGLHMSISTAGNVGIGTTTPSEKLQVVGNLHISGVGSALYFDTDASPKTIVQYVNNLYEFHIYNGRGSTSRIIGGNSFVSLGSGTTQMVYLNTSNGKVGIGNTNPISALTVDNGTNGNLTVGYLMTIGTTAQTSSSWGIVGSNVYGGAGDNIYALRTGFNAQFIQFVWNDSIRFHASSTTYTAGDSITGIEKMRITSGGNVLIGTTTNSGYKLDVAGSVNGQGIYSRGANIGMETQIAALGTSGSYRAGYYLGSTNTNYVGRLGMNVSNGDAYISLGNTTALTDVIYFKSSGNIGIGTTSPGRKLSLADATVYMSLTSTSNRTYSIGSDAYGFVLYDDTVGSYRMIVGSTGNILIGTVTDSGYKLDINGNLRVQNIPAGSSSNGKFLVHASNSAVEYRTAAQMLSDIDVPGYVSSRGENLVTNGTGLRKSNYNFSSFTFVGSDAYYTTGSFRDTVYSSAVSTDEAMPVDVNQRYRLTASARQNPYVGARYYIGVSLFDADGLSIQAPHHMYKANTLTTLAAPLNPGDTVMYLTSAANWENGGTAGVNTHVRSIILWNYTNSLGYTFPALTYSRNWHSNMWDPGAVDTVNNTITLRVPWPNSTVPAGTQLSNGNSGGTYKYITAVNVQIPNAWTTYTGIIEGVDTTGTNVTNKFAPGTAAIKVLFLNNRDVAGATVYYTNVQFALDTQNPADQILNQSTSVQTANFNISGSGYIGTSLGVGVTATNAKVQVEGLSILTNSSGASYNENIRLPEATSGYASIVMGGAITTAGTGATVWSLIKHPSANGHRFSIRNNNSTDYLTIFTTGNIGIATTTDAGYKLDVSGSARYYGTVEDASNSGTLTITTTNTNLRLGGNTTYSWIQSHSSKPLYINELGNNVILNLGGGSVGIGTSSPSAKLHVADTMQIGTTANASFSFRLTRTSGVVPQDAHLYAPTNNSPAVFYIEGGYYTGEAVGTSTAALSGYPYYEKYFGNGSTLSYKHLGFINVANGSFNNTNLIPSIALLSTGNIGIGTTSPTAALQVSTPITAYSNVARGTYLNQTLVAAANNDVLVGLDIAPTFTNGAFTGVSNIALRVNGNIIPGAHNTHSIGGANLDFAAVWAGIVRATGSLELRSGSNVTLASGGTNGIVMYSATRNVVLQNGGTYTDAGYRLDVNGTARIQSNLTVDTSTLIVDATNKRVGIGITSPTDKLHIVDSNGGNIFGRITAYNSSASAAWVAQNDQTDNVVYRVFGSTVSGYQMGISLARSASLMANLNGTGSFLVGTYSGTDLVLGTANNENMRISNNTGNVLINTNIDAGYLLDVNGSARVSGDLTLGTDNISDAWVAYTPIWSSQGGTQPNLGDGTITGFYKKIGKTVFVRVKLNFGLTTTGGTGSWLFSLPVNAANSDGIQFPCSMLDNGFAWYQGTVNGTYSGFTDKSAIITQSAGGANSAQSVTGSFPFAWGNADSLQFNGSYECI